MKTLYIVRHGQTDYNLANVVQGKGLNASLNKTGRRQAALLHRRFADVSIDFVFTSTLRRTQETAAAFLRTGLPWQPTHLLDEIGWGEIEGKPAADVREQFNDLQERWRSGFLTDRIPGGEHPIELQSRHRRFLEHYRSLPHNNILVCTHGRAMRILLSTLLGTPLREMDQYPHDNTSVYILTDDGKRCRLVTANCLAHLEAVATV